MGYRYTYQTHSESGSFGSPEGVKFADSKDHLGFALEVWVDCHDQVGSNERDAYLLVWEGEHDDVTDLYPNMIVMLGPRGGIRFETC